MTLEEKLSKQLMESTRDYEDSSDEEFEKSLKDKTISARVDSIIYEALKAYGDEKNLTISLALREILDYYFSPTILMAQLDFSRQVYRENLEMFESWEGDNAKRIECQTKLESLIVYTRVLYNARVELEKKLEETERRIELISSYADGIMKDLPFPELTDLNSEEK